MGCYLGIDVSTQAVKCIVIDTGAGTIPAESTVNFGEALPSYRSPNGFLPDADPLIRQANPLMWLEGLELALKQLAATGFDLAGIDGISGSGQQHGSVYLRRQLSRLEPARSLAEQIAPLLSRPVAPIWMDRSTTEQCRELDREFGERLRSNTGSPAIERFTGPQIRKFAVEQPEAWSDTHRIHLVSSFLCSVLCGGDAPIDFGDGAGMNLLNLRVLQWDREIAAFTAPGLPEKLPPVVSSATVAGKLDSWFTRFGFRPGIPVVVWSGDNPNSLVGTGAATPGMAGISLGTSDTFFAPMHDFKTDPQGCGHVFGNPAGGFMSLICFTNGSLAREAVRKLYHADWDFFDREALQRTPPGNGGRLLLPYFAPENTPPVITPGVRRNYAGARPEEEIRAILESQALSLRLHSSWQGEKFHRIRVTGGASKSSGFRRILADVFQAEIETIQVTNSAGLGAALRAANVVEHLGFDQLAARFCRPTGTISPNPDHAELYNEMLEKFRDFEASGSNVGA